jgi:6-pyruvoyltetrahydropterin/6-carboxytetrahydropterin synthase
MGEMGMMLTREVRFGLHEEGEARAGDGRGGTNGFAGNPGLWDVAPFLTLAATVAGVVDAATGMMVNIKLVDKVLRGEAVPFLRGVYYQGRSSGEGETRRHVGGYLGELMGKLQGRFVPHELRRLRLALSPYLAYGVESKERAMVEMSLKFEFSAAHRLHSDALSAAENAAVFGRCNNAHGHGHNYEIEVVVAGAPDAMTGEVVPVAQLQRVVHERVLEVFDHKHLNLDCADFAQLNPTVENIAKVLYGRLKGHVPGGAQLAAMRVWETPKTMCEYRE